MKKRLNNLLEAFESKTEIDFKKNKGIENKNDNVELLMDNEKDNNLTKIALDGSLNNINNSFWGIISDLNGFLANLTELEIENKKDVENIINTLIDDTTISIGMLNKVTELINERKSELISSGEEKAEELLDK